jgi:hypothetical protein
MKNIIKGWITSILGLIIIGLDIVYFFGLYDFPSPDFTPKPVELGIAFVIGLCLLLSPDSVIGYVKKVLDKLLK